MRLKTMQQLLQLVSLCEEVVAYILHITAYICIQHLIDMVRSLLALVWSCAQTFLIYNR